MNLISIMRICDGVDNETIITTMGLRPKQGNVRLVYKSFCLMAGLPSIRLE